MNNRFLQEESLFLSPAFKNFTKKFLIGNAVFPTEKKEIGWSMDGSKYLLNSC